MIATFLIMSQVGFLELDRGRAHPFEGHYSSWLEARQKRFLQEEKRATIPLTHSGLMSLNGFAHLPQLARARAKARISAYEKSVR